MKAIVLKKHGKPADAFELSELPDPSIDENQVLIDVEYSGINFADVLAVLGMYPDAPKPPSVLGYDVVGRVAKTGARVTHLKPGARVVAFTRFGGYASRVAAPGEGAIPIPDSWDAAAATALATQGCTAWFSAEEMVRIHKGDHVLIQAAAGGVGSLLVRLALRRGAVVYGTSSSPEKLERLRAHGVQHPINYKEKDFAEECRRLSGGRGMDIVFDSLGGATFRKGFGLLRAGGRIVGFGVAEAATAKSRAVRMAHFAKAAAAFGIVSPIQLLTQSKSMIGVNMLQIADSQPEVLRRCGEALAKLVNSGELQLEPATVYAASEVARAHEDMIARKTSGKLALRW